MLQVVKELHFPDFYDNSTRKTLESKFVNEAKMLKMTAHVVNVVDYLFFCEPRAGFPAAIGMKDVGRFNLEQKLAFKEGDGHPSLATKLEWARGICEGLIAVHREHMAHNDLKPANVVICEETNEAVLIDFGTFIFGRRVYHRCGHLAAPRQMLAQRRIRATLMIGPVCLAHAFQASAAASLTMQRQRKVRTTLRCMHRQSDSWMQRAKKAA